MADHAFEVEAVPSDLGVPSAPDVEFGLADDELGLLQQALPTLGIASSLPRTHPSRLQVLARARPYRCRGVKTTP
jgi:hypothetical protein